VTVVLLEVLVESDCLFEYWFNLASFRSLCENKPFEIKRLINNASSILLFI
jgi:hypothetical protein